MKKTFDMLHRSVRQTVSTMGWQSFRPIQEKAIDIIINSNNHLVICAPTASGKTEAAFLPLISRHFEELSSNLAILYISPLKALINDQFSRITALCKQTEIPVTAWHGDSSSSRKKKLIKNPRGIVMITPESIEALLLRRPLEARRMFANLQCVVIDEIHAFLAGERGIHLYSLLARIELSTGKKELRKVALSATLGDISAVKRWISQDGIGVDLLQCSERDKKVFGSITCLEQDSRSPEAFGDELWELTKEGKTLVFGNSKNSLERACDLMKKEAAKRKLPDIYRIHHGSLSKVLRENTEQELQNTKTLCVFCTHTLELGIDIGDVEKVILLSPPWTVSSFIQRIGRSGRKDGRPVQFAFLYEILPVSSESLHRERLQVELVKSIALVELYRSSCLEPYLFDLENYSCLVHEVLAYLAQLGGCKADRLFKDIVQKSFNRTLDVDGFITLLSHLKQKRYIEQVENGDILLARKGEIITANHKFYSVFHTPELWKVIHEGSVIGELPFLLYYKTGDHLLLAGERWEIKAIHYNNRQILVEESTMIKEAVFNGYAGLTSKKIHQKMKEIYKARFIPPYINGDAEKLLTAAFDYYEVLSRNKSCLFHFQGSKISNSLGVLLKAEKMEWEDFEIGFDFKNENARKLLHRLKKPDISNTLFLQLISQYPDEDKRLNKYDYLLPPALLDRSYLKSLLDAAGAADFINSC